MKTAVNSTNGEKTVGKGEISPYEPFLLFPQCFFKRLILQTCKKKGLFGKGLNIVHVGGAWKPCLCLPHL